MDTLRDYVDFMRSRDGVLEIEHAVAREDIPELVERLSNRGKIIIFRHIDGYTCGVIANLVPSHEGLRAAIGGDDPYATFLEGANRKIKKEPGERDGLETIDTRNHDLLALLPILTHYEKDSAPFITAGIVSAADPDSGVVGRGIHRMEYRGQNRLGVSLLNPPLSDILEKFRRRGEQMPVTVTVGVDPVLFLAGAMKTGAETDKLEVCGGIKGQGVKVMQSFDSAIDVPAGAEFYLEGVVDPADVRPDGPLGEISGYYMALEGTPTMLVNRLSHRPSPLYHALMPSSPEGDAYLTFVSRAHVEDRIKGLFPFVADIVFVQKTFGMSVVVAVKPADRARIRALIVSMIGFPMIKKVVVVDDDVDPYSLGDVDWAIVTRSTADRDVIIVPGLPGQPIDPEAAQDRGIAKIGIDATVQGKNIEERTRVLAGNRTAVESVLQSMGGAG
jgi:2,5-furandicarboxylate decarboxylase 1